MNDKLSSHWRRVYGSCMGIIVKDRLNEIVNETIKDVLDRLDILNEMAVPLKAYKKRVDGLRFQLVENWCLCKYCQAYDLENSNFSHWLIELRACINNLKFLDIKNGIDKGRTLRKMLINDYDYNDYHMIERIIRGKFKIEGIEDDNVRYYICKEFSDNINSLIEVISSNVIDTNEYIANIFGE